MEFKKALDILSLNEITHIVQTAANDPTHIKIGNMGSRRITATGYEQSVSINDLWEAIAKKSEETSNFSDIEVQKKRCKICKQIANQKLKKILLPKCSTLFLIFLAISRLVDEKTYSGSMQN